MREVTDEEIYHKLNASNIEHLENVAKRLHIDAVPKRRFARKEDLVDAVWFSTDNEFTRERLVTVLFGRKHAKRAKHRRKKLHMLKKHIVRIKYKIHHHLSRKSKGVQAGKRKRRKTQKTGNQRKQKPISQKITKKPGTMKKNTVQRKKHAVPERTRTKQRKIRKR